jgi:hypothetical protein
LDAKRFLRQAFSRLDSLEGREVPHRLETLDVIVGGDQGGGRVAAQLVVVFVVVAADRGVLGSAG